MTTTNYSKLKQKMVYQSYLKGNNTPKAIQKDTGVSFYTAKKYMAKLGLIDKSRVPNPPTKLYINITRPEMNINVDYVARSVYAAAKFTRQIDDFYSQSHLVKLFNEAINKMQENNQLQQVEVYRTQGIDVTTTDVTLLQVNPEMEADSTVAFLPED